MTISHGELWQNWSRSQSASPYLLSPPNIQALQDIVHKHDKIRVVGAGHSFSPLVKTDQVMVNIDQLKGLDDHDSAHYQSTLYAGTRLYDVGEKLASIDQALLNQGDIDQQSLAGAIATGTHGTGIDLPCLSAFCTGFELMTATGELLQCDTEQNSEIFQAGRVNLGSLGIMTKIQLQNRPMYRLKENIRLCSLPDIFAYLDGWKNQHRHIEFWAFIHADHVILKTLDETFEDVQERKTAWLDDDLLLTLCSEFNRICPSVNPLLQRLVNVVVRPSTVVDWSSRIFPTPRNTRFNEMEYQVPLTYGLACFEEIMATLKKYKAPVFFPIEFRYVRGDDIWLSPFYQQDSVSISIHQFYKQDYQVIFDLVEPIFHKYGARPHWGKLHSLSARELRGLYPQWDEFMQLRERLDPQQKWMNPYLERLFI